jgi:hypothetical protein
MVILARIACLWHFIQARSIVAREGVVVGRASEAIVVCIGLNNGAIPLTILLVVEIALAKGLIAISDVDAVSIVVVVAVRPRIVLRRPCYIHLPLVLAATVIGVVVNLHLLLC